MKQGFWTLKEATNFGVKKYNDKNISYLLWEKIEGPYYLINEGVLNLLKDLRKSPTTSALYDNMHHQSQIWLVVAFFPPSYLFYNWRVYKYKKPNRQSSRTGNPAI